MKEVYYVYNNEALASCIFLSLLSQSQYFDISRLCLVLPFLLDDRTTNYLLNNTDDINLELFIKQKPRYFILFNKRYLSLLPVSINSIKMLYDAKQIEVKNELITVNNSFNTDDRSLGDRFYKINQVIPTFLSITNRYSTKELYKILRVQL